MTDVDDPDSTAVWTWVAEERRALADRLDDFDPSAWDRPSLCAGWRVRDVVGHLVWRAESTRPSVVRDVSRELRPPQAAIARIARRVGAADPAALTGRLRTGAEGRFVLPGLPPAFALAEVLAHGSDALRGALAPTRPADGCTRLAADTYRRSGALFGVRRSARVRLTATDAGWSIGPEDGPAATGPGEAVLLALAGRPEGTADLEGPGAALLAS